MDHHGFLTLVRSLSVDITLAHQVRVSKPPEWKWHVASVVMPDSICAFCQAKIRSNGIWLFSNPPRYNNLVGMIPLGTNKVTVVYPGHPHLTHGIGSGGLCLGSYTTGMALLGGPANLRDLPAGFYWTAKWLKEYWNHECAAGKERVRQGWDKYYATYGQYATDDPRHRGEELEP